MYEHNKIRSTRKERRIKTYTRTKSKDEDSNKTKATPLKKKTTIHEPQSRTSAHPITPPSRSIPPPFFPSLSKFCTHISSLHSIAQSQLSEVTFAASLAFRVRHAHAVQARTRKRQDTDDIWVQDAGESMTAYRIVQWDRGVASWFCRLDVVRCGDGGGGRWILHVN